jgi:hypothetical protein
MEERELKKGNMEEQTQRREKKVEFTSMWIWKEWDGSKTTT